MNVLDGVKPVTRAYLIISLICTIIEVIGLPAQALLALDISRPLQLWRLVTSKTYLGFSMSMANNLYFLLRYGQTLETVNGTGWHAWFILVQSILLTVLGALLGFPFQAKSLIAAVVYGSCYLNPMEQM